jgi:hypothetical protein
MADDLKEKFPVTPGVRYLIRRRAAEWKAAEDERSGIEGEILFALPTLLPDKHDGLDSFDTPPRNFDSRQGGLYRAEAWLWGSKASILRTSVQGGGVPEVFQKSAILTGKGFYFERKQRPRMDVKP